MDNKLDTKTNQTLETTVASKAHYIYYYVIAAFANLIASLFLFVGNLRENIVIPQSRGGAQLTADQVYNYTVGGLIFGVVLAVILYIYLMRSRNVKAVRIWLTILFVSALAGLLFQFSQFEILPFMISIITLFLIGTALRQVRALSK